MRKLKLPNTHVGSDSWGNLEAPFECHKTSDEICSWSSWYHQNEGIQLIFNNLCLTRSRVIMIFTSVSSHDSDNKAALKSFSSYEFVSIRLYRIIQYQRNIYHWLSSVFGVHGRETHSSLLKHKLLKICTLLSMKYTVSLVPIVQLKMTILLSIVSSFVW